MFERYTERARRAIFFARYEASAFSSSTIDPEHLLLGLFREDKDLQDRIPLRAIAQVRQHLEERIPKDAPRVSTSVDLPLSFQSVLVLDFAARESEETKHWAIDTGHLVLGLLRSEPSFAVDVLRQNGIDYDSHQSFVASIPVHALPRFERPVRTRGGEGLAMEQEEPPRPPVAALAPALCPLVVRFEALIEMAEPQLRQFSEVDGLRHLKHKPWTRTEALGHLVDWATTHHQWIALALIEPRVVAPLYPSPEWVSLQQYRDCDWHDLVELWTRLNHFLVQVFSKVPEDKLAIPCRIGLDAPIPLSKLIGNYVEHCEDIMAQILVHG